MFNRTHLQVKVNYKFRFLNFNSRGLLNDVILLKLDFSVLAAAVVAVDGVVVEVVDGDEAGLLDAKARHRMDELVALGPRREVGGREGGGKFLEEI